MEKRLNKRIDDYVMTLKNEIKSKMILLGIEKAENANLLIQYIYDYERFQFQKEDFSKRKRVKNTINCFERCCAKRSNGEQCTRKKKEGNEYCGTHVKGTPHGIFDNNELDNDGNKVTIQALATTQKIEVWVEDIKGIMYYIDKNGNVYQAEDIVMNKLNPKIIAKYVRVGNTYKIPEFGI